MFAMLPPITVNDDAAVPSSRSLCGRYLTSMVLSGGAGAVRWCYWGRLRRRSLRFLIRAVMTYRAASRGSYGTVVPRNVTCYTTDGSPLQAPFRLGESRCEA